MLTAVMNKHSPQTMKTQKIYNGISKLNDATRYRRLEGFAHRLSKVFFSENTYKTNANEEGLTGPAVIYSEIIETSWSRKSKKLSTIDAHGKRYEFVKKFYLK